MADLAGVDRNTVGRAIVRVTNAICRHREELINFPETAQERRNVTAAFKAIRGFPGVLGDIDCTHVPIQSPGIVYFDN